MENTLVEYQLKTEIIDRLRKDAVLQAELSDFTNRSIQTIINVVRNNDPLLVKVGVLVWLRVRIYGNSIASIEDMIQPVPKTEAHTTTSKHREGVEV